MNKITKTIIATIFTVSLTSTVAIAATPDWVLPNKKYTPGVVNPAVTQNNIKTTVCKSGWTATIRPPVSFTNNVKNTQLKTTYASYVKVWGPDAGAYEEDHLISLQLGGDPKAEGNLFPQPYAGNNARKKDVAETALKRLVCAGTMKLKDAQHLIATDWPTAYKKYVVKTDVAATDD